MRSSAFSTGNRCIWTVTVYWWNELTDVSNRRWTIHFSLNSNSSTLVLEKKRDRRKRCRTRGRGKREVVSSYSLPWLRLWHFVDNLLHDAVISSLSMHFQLSHRNILKPYYSRKCTSMQCNMILIPRKRELDTCIDAYPAQRRRQLLSYDTAFLFFSRKTVYNSSARTLYIFISNFRRPASEGLGDDGNQATSGGSTEYLRSLHSFILPILYPTIQEMVQVAPHPGPVSMVDFRLRVTIPNRERETTSRSRTALYKVW